MFFVAGITGNTGGATAEALLTEGKAVRTLVRDPAKATKWSMQGVEVRQGDFADVDAVTSALEGVDGAYLMLPPGLTPKDDFPEARAVIGSFAEALRRAPIPRLVVLSSIGSEKPSGLGLITRTHLFEEGLANLPFPTAFIRAGYFIENGRHGLQTAASTGTFHSLVAPTDKPIPCVATADIGTEAARLLLTGWANTIFVELGTLRSPDDFAQGMSEALGRPVKAEAVPREHWTNMLEAMPVFSKGRTGYYEEMIDSINSGWIDFGDPGCKSVASPTSPAQVYKHLKETMGL